jgi:hypothetical protein
MKPRDVELCRFQKPTTDPTSTMANTNLGDMIEEIKKRLPEALEIVDIQFYPKLGHDRQCIGAILTNAHDIDFAIAWALLMQNRIDKGEKVIDIAGETSFAANEYYQLTSLFHPLANFLCSHWLHGDDLRIWYDINY